MKPETIANGRRWNMVRLRKTTAAALGLWMATGGVAFAGDTESNGRSKMQETNTEDGAGAGRGSSAQSNTKREAIGKDQQPEGTNDAAQNNAAQQAVTHIGAAVSALEKNDAKAAQSALSAAEKSLSSLYEGSGTKELAGEMQKAERGETTDLAPLVAHVEQMSTYLDPKVVAGVKSAQQKMESGDQQGASEQLRLAHTALVADVAMLPVESAYARVLAAARQLDKGEADDALRMLRNVPVQMNQIVVSAPLVPVRFEMRAAGAAAEAGKWDEARQLLDRATSQLQQVASNVPMSSRTGAQQASDDQNGKQQRKQPLQPVLSKAKDLQRQLSQGKKPKPQAFRDLAAQTRQAAGTL